MKRLVSLSIILFCSGFARSAEPIEAELKALIDDVAAVLKKHDQSGIRIGKFGCDGNVPSHLGPQIQRILVAGFRAKGITVSREAVLEITGEITPEDPAVTTGKHLSIRLATKLANTNSGLGIVHVSVGCRAEDGVLRWPGDADFRRGIASLRGQGRKIQVPEAVQFFRKATAIGHPLAAVNLAMFLLEGGAGEFDPDEGLRLVRGVLPDVRKDAELGHAESQLTLACVLSAGWSVESDHSEALKWFRKAAEQDPIPAVTRVGIAHLHGLGVEANSVEALKWLRKAAAANDVSGLYAMGRIHEFGDGVPQDFAEALKWYRKGADLHDPAAFNSIGWLYANGHGVEKDHKEALKWYHKAAEQHHPAAQTSIGFFHAEGWGVAQDFAEALKWYHKSASQNHAAAMNNLGVLHANGSGVEKNIPEAVKWFRKAAKQGSPEAKAWLKELGHDEP